MIKYHVDVRRTQDDPFGCWNCVLSYPDSMSHGREYFCRKTMSKISEQMIEDGGTLDDCPVVEVEEGE